MKMYQWASKQLDRLSSEVSSQVSSLTENNTWIPDFLQNDGARIRVGLALWIVAILIVAAVAIALLLSHRGQDNSVSSGRVFSRQREVKARPKHLLDDKYYRDPQNREKK